MTSKPYRSLSTVMPIMPEQARQDDRKGQVPKHLKVEPTLDDLHRVGCEGSDTKGRADYKVKGYIHA